MPRDIATRQGRRKKEHVRFGFEKQETTRQNSPFSPCPSPPQTVDCYTPLQSTGASKFSLRFWSSAGNEYRRSKKVEEGKVKRYANAVYKQKDYLAHLSRIKKDRLTLG